MAPGTVSSWTGLVARRPYDVRMSTRRMRSATGDPNGEPHQISTFAQLAAMSQGRRTWVLGQIGVSFLEGACEAAILTVFARLALSVVDTASESVSLPIIGERSLTVGLGVLFVIIFLRLLTGLIRAFLSTHFQFALVRALREEALDSYRAAAWLEQSRLDNGAVQQLLMTVPNGISGQLAGLINQIGNIVIMVAMLCYSMLTDAKLTTLLVFVLLGSTFLFRPLRSRIKSSANRALVRQKELSSEIAQFAGIRFEVQSFGLSEAAADPLYDAIESDAHRGELHGRLKGSVVPLFTTVTYLSVALSIVIFLQADRASLDDTGPILLVVLRSLSYGTAIQQAAAGLASLKPSLDFLRSRTTQLRDSRLAWGTRRFEAFESCVLEDVTFTYPGAEQAALREAFVNITRGMRVGIVGPSGGGKSTMVRIILGLVVPDHGRVLVNGVSLHDYDRVSWSRQVGIVPQSAQIITGSVASNVRFFRDGISEEDLWAALEIADFRSEVDNMPNGIETMIGPGHRELSGGQQQRLGIARAFAGRPEFVVMDEPTSSVDTVSEGVISAAIARIPEETTVLIVSHRPAILEGCDLLVTIVSGEITGIGEPDHLLKSSPYLRSLSWNNGL